MVSRLRYGERIIEGLQNTPSNAGKSIPRLVRYGGDVEEGAVMTLVEWQGCE